MRHSATYLRPALLMTDTPHVHILENAHASVGVRLFYLVPAARGAKQELRLSVVAKLALDLSSQTAQVLPPPPILCEDEVDRDAPMGAISASNDLAPRKPACDVTMHAHARTLGEQPAQTLPVRFAVYRGNTPLVRKALIAVGATQADGSIASITSAPLGWSRTVGGDGVRANPVGTRTPSVFLLDAQGRASRTEPAGFGPIPLGWPVRKERLDDATRRALPSVAPQLPDGVDWRAFLAAPADQQIPYLEGGEWVLIDGISRTVSRVQAQLPMIRARALVATGASTGVDSVTGLGLTWDTLAIDGEKLVAYAVLRGDIACPVPIAASEKLAIVLKFGAPNDEVPPADQLFAAKHLRPVLSRQASTLGETRGLTRDDHASAARGPSVPFANGARSARPLADKPDVDARGGAPPPWLEAANTARAPSAGRTPITAELAAPRPPAAATPFADPRPATATTANVDPMSVHASSPIAQPRETVGQQLAMRDSRAQQQQATSGPSELAMTPTRAPAPRARASKSKTELAEAALRRSGMSEERIADVLKDIRKAEGGAA